MFFLIDPYETKFWSKCEGTPLREFFYYYCSELGHSAIDYCFRESGT